MPSPFDYTAPATETPCRQCGVIALHHTESGAWGPHRRRLRCETCGAHIRWLPAHSPEHRQHQREVAIAPWMTRQPPTLKQLALPRRLGYSGEAANQLDASQLIDQLQQRGAS